MTGAADTVRYEGFAVSSHPANPRVQVVTLDKATLEHFEELTSQYGVQSLEYKPFLRFAIADALDKCCEYQLGRFLLATMNDRDTGAFLMEGDADVRRSLVDSDEQRDVFVKLSTAVSHLIGLPNFDAMYGKYYARFTVFNQDSSDSYLRQAHRRMELHNDGTYVNERTDFVLMMKMAEENMEQGDSLLLHVDDWQELERFYHHPMAKQAIHWSAPPSKNIGYVVEHPVFFEEDRNGKPHMLFIDQFAQPANMQQGLYLYEMGKSLEGDENCSNIRVNVGSMLVIQNHCWLHGRDKFVAHPGLKRELLRQRGRFTY
ncbi:glutarate dioxygenase GlaH [Endozoicomonas atrinae]|uniref:glutarate dioxygenase GlaH n=1 Tax=Endozoicomonas atrinae TaxID=1333660 RepID=UPI003B00CEB3